MANFFLGLLLVVVGGVATYYARQFEKWFWPVQWAENNLWWTAQMYVLIGFGLIVLGFMTMFWFVKIK